MAIDLKNLTSILFLAIKLKYPKYHPYWFVLYMYLIYFRIIKRKSKYSTNIISSASITKKLHYKECFDDITNTVLVNEDHLYTYDKILLLYCNKTKNSHPVYVTPVLSIPKNELHLGETLGYNLKGAGFSSEVMLLNYNRNSVNFATRVDVSLVNSPHNISNFVCDEVLKRYFKTPKLVRKSWMIEVDLKYFAYDMYLTNLGLNSVESIYFKCNKVICNEKVMDGYHFCTVGETDLTQSANTQSFLPEKKFPVCPYGLQDYLEEMETCVRPFLDKRKFKLSPIFLLQGPQGSGKEILVKCLAQKLGMTYLKVDSIDLSANVYAQNETKLHNVFFTAKNSAPCVVSIQNFENFGINNDGEHDERLMGHFSQQLTFLFENNPFPVFLFCCTTKSVPFELKRTFLETFNMNAPNDQQRELNLKWVLEDEEVKSEVHLSEIAGKTHGFFFEDLRALVFYAIKDYKKNWEGDEGTLKKGDGGEIVLSEGNFSEGLDVMQSYYKDNIGAPKVPKVLWSDVGGLEDVKKEIIQTISLPLKHPEFLKKSGLKRSGILLFGPPGTGKTLIAKAVATECGLCFLSVKGPELLNMYVGQSEQNIREVFQRAREASPCIIFFDELDSLAPNRGMTGDSGGVMNRIVSQLLAEMDGLNESATVFIIAATNRPDLIDPALLRPGRFDKLLYVSPCTGVESMASVLRALTRKFVLKDDLDLTRVVKICPQNITGADFYGICSMAWNSAVRKLIQRIESGQVDPENATEKDVVVDFEDFRTAVKDVKPSVSAEDMSYYEKLREELASTV